MNRPAIIGDLGDVLVDRNPQYLYNKIFVRAEDRDHFLNHICTSSWPAAQDAGRPDDKAENIAAAQRPVMNGILFENPEQLRRDLVLRSLLKS